MQTIYHDEAEFPPMEFTRHIVRYTEGDCGILVQSLITLNPTLIPAFVGHCDCPNPEVDTHGPSCHPVHAVALHPTLVNPVQCIDVYGMSDLEWVIDQWDYWYPGAGVEIVTLDEFVWATEDWYYWYEDMDEGERKHSALETAREILDELGMLH